MIRIDPMDASYFIYRYTALHTAEPRINAAHADQQHASGIDCPVRCRLLPEPESRCG